MSLAKRFAFSFATILALLILVAGVSAVLEQPKADVRIVYLPKVEVNGKRVPTAQVAQAAQTQQLN